MELARKTARGLVALAALFELRELFVFGGLGATVYGVSGFSVHAAWIVGGVVIFILGIRRA